MNFDEDIFRKMNEFVYKLNDCLFVHFTNYLLFSKDDNNINKESCRYKNTYKSWKYNYFTVIHTNSMAHIHLPEVYYYFKGLK